MSKHFQLFIVLFSLLIGSLLASGVDKAGQSETESQGPGYKSADGDSGARKQVRFGDVPLAQRVMKKQISPPIHSQSVRDDSGRDETAGEGSQELKVVPPPFKKVRQW